MHPLEFSHIWKRYRIGTKHDSLRDAIPAWLKRLSGGGGSNGELRDGEFWALQDASFDVAKGETLGIIGPNGAGKSTALKLLSRICKQTKGDIRVRGRLAALIEVGAGFHPDLTGRENVSLNGTIMGLSHKQIERRFEQIVAFSELGKFLDMPVKRYSSGMTVRLGFAIAAHVNPEVLLIDEVLAVGDLAFQQKCYQRIQELKAKGTTMVFISHNLDAVQRLCDRVILLEQGQVRRNGSPSEVILQYRQEVLRRAFDTQKQKASPAVRVSGDLDVTEARLLNAEGEATDEVETGEPMRVELRYRASRPIHNPSVTMLIERLDGLVCHEASTKASNLSWKAWEGEGILRLEYEALNLLPNTYQVIVTVHEGKNPSPLVRLSRQLYFHITSSDQSTRGTVHLDHEWSLEEAQRVNP
jgi:lipopolysaccharide transport system ATP-binding protein